MCRRSGLESLLIYFSKYRHLLKFHSKYKVIVYNCPHRFLSLLNNRLYFKFFLAYIYSLEHMWMSCFDFLVPELYLKAFSWRLKKHAIFVFFLLQNSSKWSLYQNSDTKMTPELSIFNPIMLSNYPTTYLQNMMHVSPILTEKLWSCWSSPVRDKTTEIKNSW